ncbi:Uncharacterised protein [Mycobacterium tuberculosis]|uniref:Uncharacterized protein n=1 Tax=Mycobacterium tuberculosis TaxID=1773 RepID=A0A654ZIU2_MYCTX|nr:Uncharacterised protein [Mycobacterium tuberculosis]CKP33147.1 Uncharacterised protein [Mycobacterium tuberculosis]CKR78581.1 Uncharacterised protein [Mycobacterium tuberculosis]COX50734.1 Uncharacterised protein [Mycobacterium tuberculosis]COX82399.1 Uncharacterised protein [Mycobacterium tuberculosis]
MQPENVCYVLHLVFIGLVQPDPDERLLPGQFDLAHLAQRGGVGVLAGQSLAADVDTAVDQGLGRWLGNGVCVRRLGSRDRSQHFGQCVKPWEHVNLRSRWI